MARAREFAVSGSDKPRGIYEMLDGQVEERQGKGKYSIEDLTSENGADRHGNEAKICKESESNHGKR